MDALLILLMAICITLLAHGTLVIAYARSPRRAMTARLRHYVQDTPR